MGAIEPARTRGGLSRRERDGVEWLEGRLSGSRVAFSCRIGGVSDPPYDSLNLGLLTGDRSDAVRENRARLAAALGLDPRRVVIGRQVHGSRIAEHRGPQRPAPFAESGSHPPDADGHVLSDTAIDPGLALLVFVADCLPVAVAGPGGIGMLHCGWRGLAAGIVGRGCRAVGATEAVIGPGIGPCCYEVGDEVHAAFAGLGIDRAASAGRRLDLPALVGAMLEREGVASVTTAGVCTMCERDRYFSHRADGPQTGRQAGLVWGVD